MMLLAVAVNAGRDAVSRVCRVLRPSHTQPSIQVPTAGQSCVHALMRLLQQQLQQFKVLVI